MFSRLRRYTAGLRQKILIYILLSSIIPLIFSITVLYIMARHSVLDITEETMTNAIQNIRRVCEIQSEEVDAKLLREIDRSYLIAKNTLEGYRNIELAGKGNRIEVQNQDSLEKQEIELPVMTAGNTVFYKNNQITDEIVTRIGNPEATATIFQLCDGKLVRISTTVKTREGNRAILTYIPSESLVYRTIAQGKSYRGRAIVLDKWNITHYEPIKSGSGKIIGAVYVGIPAPRTAVFDMIAKTKIGSTGYVFVMNSLGQTIAHPSQRGRSIYNLTDARTGFGFIKEIIRQKEGIAIYNYNDHGSVVRKIAYYTYYPNWDWYIVAAVAYDDILHSLNLLFIIMLLLLAGFTVALVATSSVLSSRISRPFRAIIDSAVKVSNGDLNTFIVQHHYVKCVEEKNCTEEECPAFTSNNKACWRIEGTLCENGEVTELSRKMETCRKCEVYQKSIRNEIDELVEAINNMIVTIRTIMTRIQSMTSELNRNAEDLAVVSRKMEIESQNQAASIEETTSAHEELIASIENVAISADRQAEKVSMTTSAMEQLSETTHLVERNALNVTNKGRQTVVEAKNSESMLKNTITSINQISESSARIGDIVRIINDVSDQINLLSLNASIEAARAGEYGRGFAVVAEEISKLAEATAASTKEIEALIKLVRSDIDTGAPLVHQTASVITSMILNIEDAANLIGQIAESTQEQTKGSDLIKSEVEEINQMSGQIAMATGEQKATSTEILKAVSRINDSIQEIAASSQVIADSARSVKENSLSLKEIAGLFKV